MSKQLTDMRFSIEPAEIDDDSRIAELLLTLYRIECADMVPANEAGLLALLHRSVSNSAAARSCTFVARDRLRDNVVVASVVASTSGSPRTSPVTPAHVLAGVRMLGPRTGAKVIATQVRLSRLLCATLPEKTTQLHSLIIDPDYQGFGIGSKLVHKVEDHARSAGDTRVHLYMLDGNDVDPFYHRLGYVPQPISLHKRAYPGRAMSKSVR